MEIKDKNAEGIMGLLPADSSHSILYDMLETNEISQSMFSLFIDVDNNNSSIKFGSYDKSGIMRGEPFNLVTSNLDNGWQFDLTNTKLASVDFHDDEYQFKATFNPAFPWIHLPVEYFTEFINLFKE